MGEDLSANMYVHVYMYVGLNAHTYMNCVCTATLSKVPKIGRCSIPNRLLERKFGDCVHQASYFGCL